jgi:hypothetical protein
MGKLKLASALLAAGLVGAAAQQYHSRAGNESAAKASYQAGRLSGCSDLIKGLNSQVAPFQLKCEIFNSKVVLTSDISPAFPKIDITDGSDARK